MPLTRAPDRNRLLLRLFLRGLNNQISGRRTVLGKKKAQERRRKRFSRWKNAYITSSSDPALEERLIKGLIYFIGKEGDPATRKMQAAELVNALRWKEKFPLMVSIARFASMQKQEAVMHTLLSKTPSPETDEVILKGLELLKLSPGTKRSAKRVLAKHAKNEPKEPAGGNGFSSQKSPPTLKVTGEQKPKEPRATTQFQRDLETVRKAKKIFEKGFFQKKWDSFLESAEKFFRREKDPLSTPFREDVKSLKEVFKKDFFPKFFKEQWRRFIKFLTKTPGQ